MSSEWAWVKVPTEDDSEAYMILRDGDVFGKGAFPCDLEEISHLIDSLTLMERSKEKGFFTACEEQVFDILFEEAPKRRAPRRKNAK